MENDEEKTIVAEGVTIRQVLEKQEFDLKEMVKEVSGIPSVYVVRNASFDMIIRRLGYNGFTIIYNISNRDGKISLDSFNETPDHVVYHIERKGKQIEENAFYDISKKYSQQQLAKKNVN